MSNMPELFERSVAEFDARVQQIGDDQWDSPTPCSEWSVHDLVNHIVYEDRWAVPLFDGKTIEEVGDRFDGDLLGADPKGAWEEASREAIGAARAEGAMEKIVHLSFGDMPGEVYLQQLLNDHVVHAWDIARGIGADDKLDPELVEVLYPWAQSIEDVLKDSGAFGERTSAPDDADTQTKLLAIMGRRA